MSKSTKKTGNPWLLLFIVLLAAIAPPLAMFKVSTVMGDIISEFSISTAQGGLVSTLFALVPIILSIPVGIIVSKYGNWKLGILSLVFLTGGSVIGAMSTSLTPMLISRMIEGAGMALIGTVGPNIVNVLFTPEKRGKAMGVFMCYIALGQAIISTVAPNLISASGSWRGVWWFTAGYGLVFLVLWILVLRRVDKKAEGAASSAEKLPVARILKNPSLWILTGVMFLFMLSFQAVLAFLTTFFIDAKGLASASASRIVGLQGYIGCAGLIGSGALLDKLGSPRKMGLAVMLVTGILFAAVPVFPAAMAAVPILLIGFVANMMPTVVFSSIPNLCEEANGIALSTGVVSTGQNLGTLFSAVIFGAIQDGIGWSAAFLFTGIVAVAGGLLMLLIRKLK